LVELRRSPTLLRNVALWIAAVGLFTTPEMRVTGDPSGLNSSTTADASLPEGHPSVVDQVGWTVRLPLAGVRLRWPGSEPLAARANPAVSSPTPAIMPTAAKIKTTRRTPEAAPHLTLS